MLIQPQADGSARVIGGAGGSLNHLRLRGVKSVSDYKAEAQQRQAERRAQKKARIDADKAAGVHDSKKEARKELYEKKKAAEQAVIRAVAKKAGWSAQDLEFPEADYAHLSEKALTKVKARHHRQLLARAKEVIQAGRDRLLHEAEARLAAGIGELPLFSDNPDSLSVADLAPVARPSAGLGFNPDYKGRAEAAGLSETQLASEMETVTQARLSAMTEAQRQAAFARGDAAVLLRKELEGIRESAAAQADSSLLSAQDALDLLKEGKRLAQIERLARDASAEIDRNPTEPKAFVLETSDEADLNTQARESVLNDLRTAQTAAFLSEVGSIAGGDSSETLGGHIGVGAYNSINSLALAVGGTALVDRSVVDVLGIAGAAAVLARRIHTDFPADEREFILDGMQDWHVAHYSATNTEAVTKARTLLDAAQVIDVPEDAQTGFDLATAQELNRRRQAATGDAQRILGQALGEMEANAALVMALRQGKQDGLQVSLGKTSPEQAIRQVRAIGLIPGDYTLDHVAGATFLSVTGAGMDRLAKPVSREDVQQVRRNLAIIRGDYDEDGWLPLGVASRPDMVLDAAPGVALRLAGEFTPGDDLKQSLQDYIGARAADGDAPADILADVQSAAFFSKVGDRAEAYRAALDAVAPLKGADGKMQRIEALAATFDQYADTFAERHGGGIAPLNRQAFDVDQTSVDALHRALSEHPEGVAAFKEIGAMTHGDRRSLRNFFHQHVARESEDTARLRSDLETHLGNAPEKETTDMFGDTVANPAWQEWRSARDGMMEKLNAASLNWPKYVKAMGGNAGAYAAIQDAVRSHVSRSFATAYNRLHPEKPLKLGKTVLRNNLAHLEAIDPQARAAREQKNRALIDSMRTRVAGKYASGSVSEKMGAAREQEAALDQAQMGFFSTEELPQQADAPMGADERHTLGHAAERRIAGMMEVVGHNFKPGQPTKLWNVSMSGKYEAQQRAIKLLEANKRVVLAAGAGSGKTNMYLGGFAHLHETGKVKRALMLVPSIVQGQFGGEALRLLEPGKFKWHIEPGASRESRIAAYRDPETHFAVMTHQSFRDDMVHLGATHAGIDEATMTEQLAGMSPQERTQWAKSVMEKEGMHFDASFIDEAHDLLNRAGKDNSSLANVTEAVCAHTPYHVYGSGDPVKNDVSEIHSMLQKMDPERYADRNAFLRRYGADTMASKAALRREMARYVFPTRITPDVTVNRKIEKVALTDGQRTALEEVNGHLAAARRARRAGKVDLAAVRALSPASFDGVPESEHATVAARIQKSLGVIKSSAINRIINAHDDNGKVAHAVSMVQERAGKQGVIFARNRASVDAYKKAMEAIGKRVVTITGSDSAKDKDAKRRLFNPEKGQAQADILIASDAGAVGMNLQAGQYLIQHDIPDTAKTHSQRQARINRIGQKQGIELIDLHADHAEERRAYDRLIRKYDLKEMMADPMDGLDDSGVAGAIMARRRAAAKAPLI